MNRERKRKLSACRSKKARFYFLSILDKPGSSQDQMSMARSIVRCQPARHVQQGTPWQHGAIISPSKPATRAAALTCCTNAFSADRMASLVAALPVKLVAAHDLSLVLRAFAIAMQLLLGKLARRSEYSGPNDDTNLGRRTDVMDALTADMFM